MKKEVNTKNRKKYISREESSYIVTKIEDAILGSMALGDYGFTPGCNLTEKSVIDAGHDIVSSTNVTQQVAREVIARLTQKGVVVHIRNRGAIIFDPFDEYDEIYMLRLNLESLAMKTIKLPISVKSIVAINDVMMAHAEAVERWNAGINSGKRDREAGLDVWRYNDKFHDIIWESCGNHRLCKAIKMYGWETHVVRNHMLHANMLLTGSIQQHQEMYEILSGSWVGDDPSKAQERLVTIQREHTHRTMEHYVRWRASNIVDQGLANIASA